MGDGKAVVLNRGAADSVRPVITFIDLFRPILESCSDSQSLLRGPLGVREISSGGP